MCQTGFSAIDDCCYPSCPSSCLNCSTYTGVWLACISNFTLVTTFNQCVPCSIANCSFCSSSNNCYLCLPNFVLSGNVCTCHIQGSNSICGCSGNYTIVNNICIPNGGISNCITLSSNYSQCTACLYGFRLIGGVSCQPFCLIANCLTCSVSGFCSTCSNNLSPSASG